MLLAGAGTPDVDGDGAGRAEEGSSAGGDGRGGGSCGVSVVEGGGSGIGAASGSVLGRFQSTISVTPTASRPISAITGITRHAPRFGLERGGGATMMG